MTTAASALASLKITQKALAVIQTVLALNAYRYPTSCTPTNQSSWDFIIIGGGAAGSVVASRLSENSNVSVLLIEAGGYAPLESSLPLAFPFLPRSDYDWQFSSENDNYTAQNMQDSCISMTQGKALGGSTTVNHMTYVLPTVQDCKEWAEKFEDDSWNYTNMQPYFHKIASLNDQAILNSTYASNHGTSGYIKIARQPSTSNIVILKAFEELGHKTLLDLSPDKPFGYVEPLLSIADGERQNNALAYLGPAKDRGNLCVALNTTAIKIIINSSNTATGVEIVNSAGETLIVHAKKEIIVSAGAINSPAILMRSGIGPKSQLTELGIDVVADLPVGENLQDHTTSFLFIKMQYNNDTTPTSNPHKFPSPIVTGYVALNSSQNNPDYQAIGLSVPHDAASFLDLCMNIFKLTDTLCDRVFKETAGRDMLFVVMNKLKPKSRGKVELTSKDYRNPPAVHMGTYSDSSDLTLMGKCLEDFSKVLDTTYFKSVNASMVDLEICKDKTGTEFWDCYALTLSGTNWHYCATCSIGVVDSSLQVLGMNGLRVIDSSTVPVIPSGHINSAVTAFAEKGSDLIRQAWNIA